MSKFYDGITRLHIDSQSDEDMRFLVKFLNTQKLSELQNNNKIINA